MAKKIYNKLIRDGIPAQLTQKGLTFSTRQLSTEEYTRAIRQKVVEEAIELTQAKDTHQLTEELADLSEVIRAICSLEKITPEDIEAARTKKASQRAVFAKRIMLEWIEE